MTYKPYVDACVVIAAIKGPNSDEPAGRPEISAQILAAAQAGQFVIHASVFLAAEVIRAGKGKAPLDPVKHDLIDQYLNDDSFMWVELDLTLALKARTLSRVHGLKPGDAIHLATAIRAGCDTFLTWNDKDFPPDTVVEGVKFAEPYLDGQGTFVVSGAP